MQRTGRKGHAMFRVVVQDSRRTPTSGKIVASLGSYDPHAKVVNINKEKAKFYVEHGAQPSDRVAKLLKQEGVKLPKWVKLDSGKKREIRNADKRRSTRPEEPKEEIADTPSEEPANDEVATKDESPSSDTKADTAPAPSEESDNAKEDASDDEKSAE